jgi:hypothetical protein
VLEFRARFAASLGHEHTGSGLGLAGALLPAPAGRTDIRSNLLIVEEG